MHAWQTRFDKAAADELARIEALTSKLTERLRKAFLAAIAQLQGQIDLKQIADLLAAGRMRDAIAAIDAQLVANNFVPLAYSITGATIEAGRAAAAGMNAVRALSGLNVQFGVTNPATVSFLQGYEFDLIAQLTQQARQAVAASVTAGVTAGLNPIDIARDVRANIGLTAQQTIAVDNYRRALQNLKRNAVDRALRDKRFDPTVLRAIANQKPLKAAQIDKMVERYRQKYLKYRAETIARTEAIRSLNAGNLQAWKQAISDGKITADQVTRKWVFTHDGRTRHAHKTIPTLNPNGVGIDEPFKSELGPILFPGDPNAAPANTINCRCTQIIRFKAAAGPAPAALAAPPPQQAPTAPIIVTQTPEEKLEAARADAEAYNLSEGRRTGRENLRWIDLDTGDLQEDRNEGEKKFVAFTPALEAAIRDGSRRIEVHHNHPSDSSLSSVDLDVLASYPGLEGVYAHGHAGSRYYATSAKPGTLAAYEAAQGRGGALPFLNSVAQRDGSLAGKLYSHARTSAVAKAGFITYRADLAPYLQSEIDADPQGWADTVDNLAAKIRKASAARLDKMAPALIDPPDNPWATLKDWQDFRDEIVAAALPGTEHLIEIADARIADLLKAR